MPPGDATADAKLRCTVSSLTSDCPGTLAHRYLYNWQRFSSIGISRKTDVRYQCTLYNRSHDRDKCGPYTKSDTSPATTCGDPIIGCTVLT